MTEEVNGVFPSPACAEQVADPVGCDDPDELVDIGPASRRILTCVAGALPASRPRAGYNPVPRSDTRDYVRATTARARNMVNEQEKIMTSLTSASIGLYQADREIAQLQRDMESLRARNKFTVCHNPVDYVYHYKTQFSLKDFIPVGHPSFKEKEPERKMKVYGIYV